MSAHSGSMIVNKTIKEVQESSIFVKQDHAHECIRKALEAPTASFKSIMMLLNSFSSVADIISAVEFNQSGKHLATGDRGGRVVVFEHIDSSPVISHHSK